MRPTHLRRYNDKLEQMVLECTFLRQKLYESVEVVPQCYGNHGKGR